MIHGEPLPKADDGAWADIPSPCSSLILNLLRDAKAHHVSISVNLREIFHNISLPSLCVYVN